MAGSLAPSRPPVVFRKHSYRGSKSPQNQVACQLGLPKAPRGEGGQGCAGRLELLLKFPTHPMLP